MSNTYAETARVFIEHIRRSSGAAADCIEQIRAKYGTRAAYLAAFALLVYQTHLTRAGNASAQIDLKIFSYYDEMQTDPEAIRLYEEAAEHLLSQV